MTLAIVVGCTGIASGPQPTSTSSAIEPAGSAGPRPTNWPGNVIDGLIDLAAVDAQFQQVGTDLSDAVGAGDLKALLVITNNVKTFLTANQKHIPPLQAYPPTKTLGDGLADAYSQMIAGITRIQDSLTAGNGSGVTAGFTAFTDGYSVYGNFRTSLGDMATQALNMKRKLNL